MLSTTNYEQMLVTIQFAFNDAGYVRNRDDILAESALSVVEHNFINNAYVALPQKL
jgi:hypothetical protein